jgi:hypothetical protein
MLNVRSLIDEQAEGCGPGGDHHRSRQLGSTEDVHCSTMAGGLLSFLRRNLGPPVNTDGGRMPPHSVRDKE